MYAFNPVEVELLEIANTSSRHSKHVYIDELLPIKDQGKENTIVYDISMDHGGIEAPSQRAPPKHTS